MRKIWLICAALFGSLSLASSFAWGAQAPHEAVTVTEGTVTMPTYEQTRELQPSLFPDSATTGVYPFPTYVMPLPSAPVTRKYAAIFVENEYLKLTYIPEFGGRFMELYDKLRKRQVFYRNDVIKPTAFNPRQNWPQEGIELTGPFDIHSLTLHFDPYWSNTVHRQPDGSVSITLGEIDPFYGMDVTLSATLYPGVAAMQIGVFCFNPNTSRMPQMLWTNAAFPTTPETQFLYPMTRTVGHNTGQVTGWPMYQGIDYSWDRNNKNMLGVFGIDQADNFGGAYMYDQDYGVFRFADRRVVQGMKMWTWGHGRDSEATEHSYTDTAGPYYEAQSGRHVWDGHYEWVGPHQVERWSEWWVPVAGTKGLTTLTDAVALHLGEADARNALELNLSPVRSYPHATLKVTSSSGTLLSEDLDLRPGDTVHRTLDSKQPLRDLTVDIRSASGGELLHYVKPNPDETRSEHTPFTVALEHPAKSPAEMSSEELVLAAEFRLKELDDAGALHLLDLSLQKDPGYSVAHTLQGITFYKQGKLREAEQALQAAVDRDPYADRAMYYLAVTQIALGETAKGERNLYFVWPDSAFYGNREYQLGLLLFRRGQYTEAIQHLKGAVTKNGEDLSAHHLLALSFRLTDQKDQASAEIETLLRIDPSNRAAYAERFFLTGAEAARHDLQRLMGDQSQEAIHVAEFYSNVGRWSDAATILKMEDGRNSDPFGTSAVFFYTLAFDQKNAGDATAAAGSLARARSTSSIVDRFPYLPSSEAPLQAAVTADPKDTLARFDLGCLLYYLGRQDEALKQWEAAEATDPKEFKLERVLGLADAERGNLVPAITHLERAVALDPSHMGTTNDLATLYARSARFDDERKLLQQALAQTSDQDDLMLRLLHADLVQGRYEEAEQIVTTHSFAPRHRDYQLRDEYRALKYAQGSRAFQKGDFALALKQLQAAENPPPSLGVDDFQFQSVPRLRYASGRILEALHRDPEAKQAYEQSVKDVDLTAGDRATYNDDTVFMLLALDRLGRKAESDDLRRRFESFAQSQLPLKRIHRQAEGHYLLAIAAQQKGDAKEALAQLQSAAAIEPDFLYPVFDLRGDAIGMSPRTKP